jgi:tripartite-type tricarboxylate transporter receptor subunit TctC
MEEESFGDNGVVMALESFGKIRMASGGIGSSNHLYGELFKMMAMVDMLHVPYRGGAPALIDLVAGQVDLTFEPISTAVQHIRAGTLRALAVTTTGSSDALPSVPPMGQFLPGYEATAWQGIVGPKDMPAEIIDRLNREINAGLADPSMRNRIVEQGYTPLATTPAEFRKLIVEDTQKWAKVIRAANITAD